LVSRRRFSRTLCSFWADFVPNRTRFFGVIYLSLVPLLRIAAGLSRSAEQPPEAFQGIPGVLLGELGLGPALPESVRQTGVRLEAGGDPFFPQDLVVHEAVIAERVPSGDLEEGRGDILVGVEGWRGEFGLGVVFVDV
jgi:hypothetical protein